jgi:hypothetical protein
MEKKVEILNDSRGLSQVRPVNTTGQKKTAAVSKVNSLLEKVAATPAGRQAVINKIAKYLAEPLRMFLDVNGIARNFFVRDNKNEGELAYYDIDLFPLTNAMTLGVDGNPIINWVAPRRFFLNHFIIGNIVKVHFHSLKWYRYDVITRAKDRLKESLMYKEDMLFFKLATAAADAGGNLLDYTSFTTSGEINPTAIGQMMTRLEVVPLQPYALIFHPVANATVRSWVSGQASSYTIDEVGRVEVRTTGFLGNIFGLNIFITKLAPIWKSGNDVLYTAHLLTAPEYFGVMPMWADTEIYASNNMDLFAVGFVAWEMLGMGIWNPRATVAGIFKAQDKAINM